MKALKLFCVVSAFAVASLIGFLGSFHFLPHTGQAKAHWAQNFKGLDEAVRGVDLIVLAKVEKVSKGRTALSDAGTKGSIEYNAIDFQVERILKGKYKRLTLTLEQTAGVWTARNRKMSIDDGGSYKEGERYILFLNKQPKKNIYYLVNSQGRFNFKGDKLCATLPGDPVACCLHGASETDALKVILGAKKTKHVHRHQHHHENHVE